MAETSSEAGVFGGCKFAIVRSDKLGDETVSEAVKAIQLHGGQTVIDNYPDTRLDLSGISHIISETFDFPDYHDSIDTFIPVLKTGWIHTSIASSKLAHPRKFSPDPRLFMSNVVATCADLPTGDRDAIAGGILAMGGNYSTRVTALCTHIVALSTENEKVEQVLKNNLKIHVVLPHWFDDCLKLGKLIGEGPYLLPDPEILRGMTDIPKDSKSKKNMVGAVRPDPQEPPEMKGRASLRVFKDKRIMLDSDLEISDALRHVLGGIILTIGKVVRKVSDADIFICKYRSGPGFEAAMHKNIDVGNLAWLYHLIVHDVWTSPLRRLLHFPVPKEPLPGFENFKIALSNYTGEARTFLEHLTIAIGAESTKTLKQDNTHLITAHRKSEKVQAAEEWSVKVVNHLWLEECYTKWQVLAVTTPRYVHFPARTNLGEVVGLTQIDRDVIEAKFLKQKPGKRIVDTNSPSFSKSAGQDDTGTSQDDNGSPTPKKPRTNGKSAATPAARRMADVVPPSTGRASKQKAAAKLQDMSSDIALYEKERKRVGGVERGGRRKDDPDRVDVGSKRSAESSEPELETAKVAKKQRTGSAAPHMRLLISSYPPWNEKLKKENQDRKTLRDIGVEIVADASMATHVAVPKVIRTAKFLTALAEGLELISTEYVDDCLREQKYLNPADYPLSDLGGHDDQMASVASISEKARANQRKLLKSYVVYGTDKISGGFETLKTIVETNGGTLTPYRGRSITVPTEPESSGGDGQIQLLLLSNDTAEDRRLWPRFVKAAEEKQLTPRVVRAEWLLQTALLQEIQPIESHEFGQDGK